MSAGRGNLFGSDAPDLGHGVSLAGVMCAGIAKQFAVRHPDMPLPPSAPRRHIRPARPGRPDRSRARRGPSDRGMGRRERHCPGRGPADRARARSAGCPGPTSPTPSPRRRPPSSTGRRLSRPVCRRRRTGLMDDMTIKLQTTGPRKSPAGRNRSREMRADAA